jgi:hypothetical protein
VEPIRNRYSRWATRGVWQRLFEKTAASGPGVTSFRSAAAPESAPSGSRDGLRAHLDLFIDACNHARLPNALRGLRPCEFACERRTKEPDRLKTSPSRHRPGRMPGARAATSGGASGLAADREARSRPPRSFNLP